MNDKSERGKPPAGKLFVCNCEASMTVDPDAIARALRAENPPHAFTQLCRRELRAFDEALATDEPILVACTQEAPLFSERALDAPERTSALRFTSIRETAGWSADPADKTPKMAALIAAAGLEAEPTPLINVHSAGQCLVYGHGQAAVDVAEQLAPRLSVTLVLTDPGDAIPPRVVNVPLHTGHIRSVRGTLGNFELAFDRFAPAVPSSRAALTFERPRDGFRATCDIIIDIAGGAPLFSETVRRDGYLRADPGDPIAVAKLAFEAADLVGEFEKPLYVTYDGSICAHARSAKIGCRNCLDNCPASAITPAGDVVSVDPAICGGCGSCSAVCPTGAVSYAYPARGDLISRLQLLATTYHAAGGQAPVLLIHDETHGTALIDMMARFGRGLPASVIPLPVYSVFQIGHDALAAAFAAGFTHAVFLAPPDKPHDLPPLESQVTLIGTLLAELGYGGNRLMILSERDPDPVEAALYALPVADIPRAPTFEPVGNKREIARTALSALNRAAPKPQERVALLAGAPYGRIVIDTDNCTLCLACVGACPPSALTADADYPRLTFTEQACVQCGLCVATCPEKVITLDPRFDFTPAVLQPVTLKEEEPFECISCGKPFGTRSSIERIISRLEGQHAMFQNQAQTDLIRMCDNCRVIALAERGGDPMTMGERPRVRTTDDYISGDIDDTDDNA